MMVVEDKETVFCSNCKKDVAASNYPIHEIHCKRFIQLCPLCNEAVPTAELQEHREREHRQVQCSQCHKKLEQCKLKTHEDEECAERLLRCRFCDLETPCRTLPEHEEACGSRTNRCPDCGKYIMYRDQESHEQSCPGVQNAGQVSAPLTGETSKIPCEFCTKMFPEDKILHHQDGCRPLSGLVERFRTSLCQDPPSYTPSTSYSHLPSTSYSQLPSTSYPQLPSTSYSHLPSTSYSHLFDPPFFSPLPPHQLGALPLSSPGSTTFGESEDLDEIGCCQICDCALPLELLKQHEKKCRFFDQQRKKGMRQKPINESDLL
ncbi:XIAP-associated factor 1 isoform X1 [Cetorhinus maximus]